MVIWHPVDYLVITVRIRASVIVSAGRTEWQWVISGLLSAWTRTAERRCCLCIHIPLPHYPHPNPNPKFLTLSLALNLTLKLSLTLNHTLISSYLTNKHQYAQPNMSANWMTSRLRDQSAARCKNCRPVPIGYTDNSLECADLSVRGYAPYWQ